MIQEPFLFDEMQEDCIERKMQLLEKQMNKVRKNLFAKYTELMQLYIEQKNEIDDLKKDVEKSHKVM